MPTLLRLRLLVEQNVVLRADKAPVHGWFLALLRQIDPAWAESLHGSGQRHPYSVSPFYSPTPGPLDTEEDFGGRVLMPVLSKDRLALIPVQAGATVALRIGFAHDEDARRVCRALAAGPVPPLGGAPCRLIHVPHGQSGDPDCLPTTWAMLEDAPPARTLCLRFHTLTSFSTNQGETLLLPEPARLWDSWRRAWHFAPALPAGGDTVTTEGLQVARYDLWTEALFLKDGITRGFVGSLELEWRRDVPPDVRRAACALAGIADFLGTGRKTMMGMGQTRFTVLD